MKTDKYSLDREQALKTIPYNDMTSDDINFLEEQGIINGVGPEKYGKWIRVLMTWLFKFLKYPRHDVGFWQQIGFHLANWGILKYSFISIAEDYKQICTCKWYKKLYKLPKYYITLPFKAWIISIAYNAVESDIGLEAYNNSK